MIALVILIIILTWYITIYNRIKILHKKVLQSKSGIEVYLNQRFDLIPNLVECVKGYVNHEQKILETIIKERKKFYETKNLSKGAEISNKCNEILALQENYPDLKASEQFLSLQDSLIKMENQLQAARRLYNSDVTMYNTEIETFPGLIVAKLLKLENEELFEIQIYKKENIDISGI